MSEYGKTLIGVLASHDYEERNERLARLFDSFKNSNSELLRQFRFVFTGGTYNRIIDGTKRPLINPVDDSQGGTKEFLLNDCGILCLPSRLEAGVTILAHLVVMRKVSIIWAFLTPLTSHWLFPENLALKRLCDQCHAKRLMNAGSVQEWFEKEAERDSKRNPQSWYPKFDIGIKGGNVTYQPILKESFRIKIKEQREFPTKPEQMSIALIAHDEMKNRMVDFATDYEPELARFSRILCTGTTGRLVAEAAPSLKSRISLYRSGPKGGDIEIATEILFGCCHVVVFFIDPLNPHPHIEDIRVVFGACMIQDKVRMLSNEMQARDWMSRIVRGT